MAHIPVEYGKKDMFSLEVTAGESIAAPSGQERHSSGPVATHTCTYIGAPGVLSANWLTLILC
jgi:hypothetical protein